MRRSTKKANRKLSTPSEWTADLIALLLSTEPNDWPRAFELKRQKTPPNIFQYKSPNVYALDCLRKESIWVSPPAEFNDPFDSSITVDAVSGLETHLGQRLTAKAMKLPAIAIATIEKAKTPIAGFQEVFEQEVERQEGPEAAERAKDFFRNRAADQSAPMTDHATNLVQKGLKVSCFTVSGTSLTHWAHYAGYHRGFCINYSTAEFFSADNPRGNHLYPIHYTAKRYAHDWSIAMPTGSPRPPLAVLAALHKSPEWADEREWRIVLAEGGSTPGHYFQMPLPVGITLGARMTADYRKQVVEIAEEKNIPLFDVELSRQEFELILKPIT